MKILIVTQYFWPESFKINDLSLELKNRGHEITVYTGLPNYPSGTFFKGYSILHGPYQENYNGIKIIRSPLIPRGNNRGILLVLNYLSFCLLATALAPFLIRGQYDKIFMYELSPIFSALPAVFLRWIKKAPMIIWITDLWPESLEATGVVKNKKILSFVGLFVKFIYRYSDKIYTSSRGFIPRIEVMVRSEAKIKFWPQWAENIFNNYDPTISTYEDKSLPKDGFIVMFAGNIGTSQDLPTVLEAFEKLKGDRDIHLVILGDGLMKSWIETEIIKKNLQHNVHLLGKKPLDMMPYYYSKADVMLVSLTKTDLFSITLPSKLQSYLASKKPVLASLDGEGAEVVKNWNAGLCCPAGNADLLAKTILNFSTLSKEELAKMGNNAYNCYKSEFDREKLISELEKDLQAIQL